MAVEARYFLDGQAQSARFADFVPQEMKYVAVSYTHLDVYKRQVVCRAKKSVANFKLRQGTPIGCKVTLRGERMYEFVDRFFNVALPRVRDFRGINGNGFDGRGNFACGIKEQIIFPEIDFDKVDAVRGMDVCFVTTAKTDEEGKELLQALGAPFATENN